MPKDRASGDPAKVAAADALAKKPDEVLNHANHNWYLNKMDPAGKAGRERSQQEFQKRYAKLTGLRCATARPEIPLRAGQTIDQRQRGT